MFKKSQQLETKICRIDKKRTFFWFDLCVCVSVWMRACSVYRLVCGAVVQSTTAMVCLLGEHSKIQVYEAEKSTYDNWPHVVKWRFNTCSYARTQAFDCIHRVYVGPCMCSGMWLPSLLCVVRLRRRRHHHTNASNHLSNKSKYTIIWTNHTRPHKPSYRISSRNNKTYRCRRRWNTLYIYAENRYSLNNFNSYFSFTQNTHTHTLAQTTIRRWVLFLLKIIKTQSKSI